MKTIIILLFWLTSTVFAQEFVQSAYTNADKDSATGMVLGEIPFVLQPNSATDTTLSIYNNLPGGVVKVIIRGGEGNPKNGSAEARVFEILDTDSTLSIQMRKDGFLGAKLFASTDDTTFTITSYNDAYSKPGIDFNRSGMIVWSNGADWWGTKDVGLKRKSAGLIEIKSSVAGTYRDLVLRNISIAGIGNYVADAQANDTYVVALTHISAYTAGLEITFKANTANTDGATVNVNGLGAKALTKASVGAINTALATGDILAGQIIKAVYDGTQFQVISRLAQ